jgi:hypothetical protein
MYVYTLKGFVYLLIIARNLWLILALRVKK